MKSQHLKKHTLHLREGDWDYLESLFYPHGVPTSLAIRTIVSDFVDRKQKEERENGGQLPQLDLKVEL